MVAAQVREIDVQREHLRAGRRRERIERRQRVGDGYVRQPGARHRGPRAPGRRASAAHRARHATRPAVPSSSSRTAGRSFVRSASNNSASSPMPAPRERAEDADMAEIEVQPGESRGRQGRNQQRDDLAVALDAGRPNSSAPTCITSRVAPGESVTARSTLPA